MDPISFAAARKSLLESADEALEPYVDDALHRLLAGDPDWDEDLVMAASQLWLQVFDEESDDGNRGVALARFRKSLRASLAKTSDPGMDVEEAQVNRITYWLSGYAVNSATVAGAFSRGVRFKRWVTMHDDSVREIHVATDGQIVPIGGTFSVSGEKLRHPGEPVGDPEIWIQCRCLAQPAGRDGEAMSSTTYAIGPDDEIDDNPDVVEGYDIVRAAAVVDETDIAVEPADEAELPDIDEPEDGEELITEIPVHGVLAPEGVSTGDGRKFALGALSTRPLPLPLRYETVGTHGGQTSDVVTVGRIDEAWRDEATDSWRFRGAVVLTKPFAQEVIDGLVDGTIRGISIDGDDAEIEIPEEPTGEGDDVMDAILDMMNPGETVFSKMRVAGATIVPIPAFQEAYTALGHEFQEDLSEEQLAAQAAALQACGCATGEYREFPPEEREKQAEQGNAMPDGSYPIENCEDLANAIQAIGRASDPEATKAHIRKRAAALDCPDIELPEDWSLKPWPGDLTAEEQAEFLAEIPGLFRASAKGEAFAPGTRDAPGWITHPVPTQRLRNYWTKGAGASKIRWGQPGDFNRCRTQLAKYIANPDWLAGACANLHKEALGFWPAQHRGKISASVIAAAGAPVARLVQPEHKVYPAEYFSEPTLDRAYPMKIDRETRRIHGYVSEWGVCHVGITGFCQEVPTSTTDYGYFKKGVIDTTEGEQFVGCLSWGGHASERMSMAAASAFYDKPDAVRAFVNVGENAYGVWFSGIIPPDVTDEDITKMRAIGAVSGDWREVRGNLELIGVPVVNTPGLPVRQLAASAGRQTVMIGAGALKPEPVETFAVNIGMDPEFVAGLVRTAVDEYRHREKIAARAEPARAKVRQRRLAAARAQVQKEG